MSESIHPPLEQKLRLQNIKETDIDANALAGDKVLKQLVKSPEGAALEGIKLITEGGWFAARPSGTEDIIKLYAESYRSAAHLIEIQHAAQELLR
jgi:phosphoglucomutase